MACIPLSHTGHHHHLPAPTLRPLFQVRVVDVWSMPAQQSSNDASHRSVRTKLLFGPRRTVTSGLLSRIVNPSADRSAHPAAVFVRWWYQIHATDLPGLTGYRPTLLKLNTLNHHDHEPHSTPSSYICTRQLPLLSKKSSAYGEHSSTTERRQHHWSSMRLRSYSIRGRKASVISRGQIDGVPDTARFFTIKAVSIRCVTFPSRLVFLINTQGTGYVNATIRVNMPATRRWQSTALPSTGSTVCVRGELEHRNSQGRFAIDFQDFIYAAGSSPPTPKISHSYRWISRAKTKPTHDQKEPGRSFGGAEDENRQGGG